MNPEQSFRVQVIGNQSFSSNYFHSLAAALAFFSVKTTGSYVAELYRDNDLVCRFEPFKGLLLPSEVPPDLSGLPF